MRQEFLVQRIHYRWKMWRWSILNAHRLRNISDQDLKAAKPHASATWELVGGLTLVAVWLYAKVQSLHPIWHIAHVHLYLSSPIHQVQAGRVTGLREQAL